jgi:hypothetical protein
MVVRPSLREARKTKLARRSQAFAKPIPTTRISRIAPGIQQRINPDSRKRAWVHDRSGAQ